MDIRLNHLADKIRKQSNIPEEEEFGSIIAILMVISIILTLVRVIQECNKRKTQNFGSKEACDLYGQEIKMFSMKRGYFTKMRIKKVLRQKMSKDQYAKYSMSLLNAILDAGENINQQETYSIMEAINNV